MKRNLRYYLTLLLLAAFVGNSVSNMCDVFSRLIEPNKTPHTLKKQSGNVSIPQEYFACESKHHASKDRNKITDACIPAADRVNHQLRPADHIQPAGHIFQYPSVQHRLIPRAPPHSGV